MKRDIQVSLKITQPARDRLDFMTNKFERSQGYLIEKMIDRAYLDIEKAPVKVKPVKSPSTRFKPPTVEDVFNYCKERCNNVDAQNFVDHYIGNGWVRGKTKIKDWKACVRTWEKTTSAQQTRGSGKTVGNFAACEDFINE